MENKLKETLEIIKNKNTNQVFLEDDDYLYNVKFIENNNYCLIFQDLENELCNFEIWDNDIKDIYMNDKNAMKIILYDVVNTIQD